MALIKAVNADVAASIAYSHKPLAAELGRLGIRQLEWDLYADPKGGLFADPAARKLVAAQGGDPGPSHADILSPDDVRGDAETLREASLSKGWPLLDVVRAKVFFALDNGGEVRDRYLAGHPPLRGRLLFATVDEDNSAAAWFRINDPMGDFDRIQRLVKAGFLVRTRADAGTTQSRKNDPTQRDKALASGAQFVSTDYPEPDPISLSDLG